MSSRIDSPFGWQLQRGSTHLFVLYITLFYTFLCFCTPSLGWLFCHFLISAGNQNLLIPCIQWSESQNVIGISLLNWFLTCIQSEVIFSAFLIAHLPPQKSAMKCVFHSLIPQMLIEHVPYPLLYQTHSRHFITLRKMLTLKNCRKREKVLPLYPATVIYRKTVH